MSMYKIKKIIIFTFISFHFLSIEVLAIENFFSLKYSKVNVRYGPGKDYPIKFIYKKKNLPIKIIDKKENYRRIIDLKKNSGWIHWTQLKKANSFIILENKILFKKPTNFSKPIANLEKGRLLIVKKCQKNWCNIKTGKYSGWVKTNNTWGSIR